MQASKQHMMGGLKFDMNIKRIFFLAGVPDMRRVSTWQQSSVKRRMTSSPCMAMPVSWPHTWCVAMVGCSSRPSCSAIRSTPPQRQALRPRRHACQVTQFKEAFHAAWTQVPEQVRCTGDMKVYRKALPSLADQDKDIPRMHNSGRCRLTSVEGAERVKRRVARNSLEPTSSLELVARQSRRRASTWCK